ncbi:MAG: DNA-directed RNA polymerase omega subunit, partial [uncultured Solirubrobacteraceae bacterium]
DLAPHRHPARERRLELRVRSGGRQARPPDQLVLPQPRRGDLRRVPAADDRHGLEELPHDRARGSCRGQDQIPVPL